MAKSLEEEIKDIREKNIALVQKAQYWKMLAGQKEDEKVDLIKEINELRLTLSRYRNAGRALDRVLDACVQEVGEHSLARLVEVSSTITRSVELIKSCIRQKQDIEVTSPQRGSAGASGRLSARCSPRARAANVLRVEPMIGGRSINPAVLLTRHVGDAALSRRYVEDSDTNHAAEDDLEPEPLPRLPTLQDLYIPLRRIDDAIFVGHTADGDSEDSLDELSSNRSSNSGVEERLSLPREADHSGDVLEEEDYNAERQLEDIPEDAVSGDVSWSAHVRLGAQHSPHREGADPLEGPSWLLGAEPPASPGPATQLAGGRVSLEPDSTTDAAGLEAAEQAPPTPARALPTPRATYVVSDSPAAQHSPTVRRRKRPAPAQLSPAASACSSPLQLLSPPPRRSSQSDGRKNNKVLKVMLSKIKLELFAGAPKRSLLDEAAPGSSTGGERVSPARRPRLAFDAPSPNGATTDAGLIVMESSSSSQGSSGPERTAEGRGAGESGERLEAVVEQVKRERSAAERRTGSAERDTSGVEPRLSSAERSTEQHTGSGEESEGETRSRRPRRAPRNYKEKPLNRKLRR